MGLVGRLLDAARRHDAPPVAAAPRGDVARQAIARGVDLNAAAYGPAQYLGSHEGWLTRHIGPSTKASVPVSEALAMRLPVVYACVNRIANPFASFPIRIYRRRAGGGMETVNDHPLSRKLQLRPNEFMSGRTLRKALMQHTMLWGNGYQEIERNGRGQAVGLWPLLPDRTTPVRANGGLIFRSTIDGRAVDIGHDDVIHLMDLSQDGFTGISPIAMAREAVGMGLAMEEFGAKFFANDAKSGGFLMHPGKLGAQAHQNIRSPNGGPAAPLENPGSRLERQGGLDSAHRVKVLEEGMKFVSTTIPPEDAQFLGSREFQIAELARIYDVPLVLLQSTVGTTSWGTGIEQLMIGFVRQTIEPWVRAYEQELDAKLFTEDEQRSGMYVKMNMNAMLRGDMAARGEFYKSLFAVGGISPNRVLELEEEEPIGPDGDHHFVPVNYMTIERAAAGTANTGATA